MSRAVHILFIFMVTRAPGGYSEWKSGSANRAIELENTAPTRWRENFHFSCLLIHLFVFLQIIVIA